MTISRNCTIGYELKECPFKSVRYINSERMICAVIRDIIKWIDGHLDVNLRLNVITSRSGYTHWYFQRRFREITGISIAGYIRICRVVNATKALITSNKNIMSIAMDNGFSSQQTFTRVYRQYVNEPPGFIRKTYCGEPDYAERLRSDMLQHYPFFHNLNAVSQRLPVSLSETN